MIEGEWPGIYRGVVSNDVDPEARGRIKALVPNVYGDGTTETNWAWPCYPAGSALVVPSAGAGVWLMFQGGDVDYPVWMGVAS